MGPCNHSTKIRLEEKDWTIYYVLSNWRIYEKKLWTLHYVLRKQQQQRQQNKTKQNKSNNNNKSKKRTNKDMHYDLLAAIKYIKIVFNNFIFSYKALKGHKNEFCNFLNYG